MAKKKSKEKILDIDIVDPIKEGMLRYYAATAIRMIPSCLDGLKETQRKVIYVMYKNKIFNFTKNNKVIGDIVPYVPTGDSGIYGTLIRLGQYDRYKNTLIVPQGNYGYAANGLDEFASQRYTESKLSDYAKDLYFPEYWRSCEWTTDDTGTMEYPKALPTILPMALILGTSGTGLGYKNDCPPHSMRSIAKAYIQFIEWYNSKKQDPTIVDKIIKGIKLSFPNKTKVLNLKTNTKDKGLLTGKGKILTEGSMRIETVSYGRNKICITELPYLVSTPSFCDQIRGNKKAKDLFSDLSDYSGKEGLLIELTCKKDTDLNEAIEFINYSTSYRKQFNYSLLWNDDKIVKRLGVMDVFKIHYDYKLNCINRHFNSELEKLEIDKLNMETLKFILENEKRRNKFFDILKSSNKDNIKANMYRTFGKLIPNLNDEAVEYVITSRFNLFLNKAEVISEAIKNIKEKIKRNKDILKRPDLFMVKEINEIIKKY